MAEQIGRYEIVRELGRGGMATVYLASDPRFGRLVAIKVLPRQFTHDPNFRKRFNQEAKTIAALEHKAIVPVYDFGEHEDAPYLVMRYMPGGSLRDLLEKGRLEMGEAARILSALAPALDAAHTRGIIHRDLKPANVLFDKYGDPCLADFGIARLAEATQTMTIVGTPAYMSPEQVSGEVALDGRSDIYALGAVLYEMLTGQPPYTANTPSGLMFKHVTEPVPDILAANPALPAGTRAVINKVMAKDREQRYATARELAADVAALADGQTRTAAPRTMLEEQIAAGAFARPGGDRTVLDRAPERARGATQPPFTAAAKSGLPGWAWWAGALALLVVVILGVRALLGGPDPAAEAPAVEEAAPAEEEAPAVVVEVAETATWTPTATAEPTETPEPAVDPNLSPVNAELGDTWVRPADRMRMVYAPAGSFPMGSEEGDSDEQPVHDVELDAFWIDSTEVTNDQYARFVDAAGYETTAEKEGSSYVYDDGAWQDTPGADWRHPEGPGSDLDGRADHPVIHVSWFDAEAYCAWAEARLPTEAEWEYAARGPEGRAYPWGDNFNGEKANFCDVNCPLDHADEDADDGYEFTAPAGSYADGASWVGALDMAGNVWEWVNDWYDSDYYGNSPGRNPPGPAGGDFKVLRGGSWYYNAYYLRGAVRINLNPDFRYDSVGFRCAVAPGK